jgi:sulfur-carrier protein
MPQFRIPGPLRSLSDGRGIVPVDAGTVRAAIAGLDSKHPGFQSRLLDESGELRQFVNIFVNDEDVRLGQGLDTPLGPSDELAIVPAVAGGTPSEPSPPGGGGGPEDR